MKKYSKIYGEVPVSHNVVREALAEYRRPNDKINQLVQRGTLIALRRGLYAQNSDEIGGMPSPLLIANHLRGPSYVTLETALSFWNMIPERVYEISSATLKTKKTYKNNLGRFTFYHVSFPYFSFGINNVRISEKQTAMVASPEKAICDKIILTPGVNLRSKKQAKDFLLDDMRIDIESLKNLNLSTIASWIEDAPKKNSLNILLKTINDL